MKSPLDECFGGRPRVGDDFAPLLQPRHPVGGAPRQAPVESDYRRQQICYSPQLCLRHLILAYSYSLGWDPFDHSEGSFRPDVKKSKKSLEMGSRGLPAPGGRKGQKRVKNEFKIDFLRLLNCFLTLF